MPRPVVKRWAQRQLDRGEPYRWFKAYRCNCGGKRGCPYTHDKNGYFYVEQTETASAYLGIELVADARALVYNTSRDMFDTEGNLFPKGSTGITVMAQWTPLQRPDRILLTSAARRLYNSALVQRDAINANTDVVPIKYVQHVDWVRQGPTQYYDVATTVVLTGTGFTGAAAVYFTGDAGQMVSAVFTVDSNTQITAIQPLNASTGPIVVVNAGAYKASTTDFEVTLDGVPYEGEAPVFPLLPVSGAMTITSMTPATAENIDWKFEPGTVALLRWSNLNRPAQGTDYVVNGYYSPFYEYNMVGEKPTRPDTAHAMMPQRGGILTQVQPVTNQS